VCGLRAEDALWRSEVFECWAGTEFVPGKEVAFVPEAGPLLAVLLSGNKLARLIGGGMAWGCVWRCVWRTEGIEEGVGTYTPRKRLGAIQ